MNQTLRRIFVMLCAGVGVWILVFWLYEPRDPTVTYGGRPYHAGGNTLAQIDTISDGPAGDDVFGSKRDTQVPLPEVDPAAAPANPEAAGTAPTLTPPPTFAPRVIAPEFWEYTVQRGDNTWEGIAEKTLGDRKLASAVLRANPLVSPDKLVPGRTRLKIPRDPKNIQGKVVTEAVAAPGVNPADAKPASAKPSGDAAKPVTPPAAPTAAPAPAAGRTHTVGKGETLSQIAQTYLGSAAKWREIYEANKVAIADPDHLKLGTVLKIPGEQPKP